MKLHELNTELSEGKILFRKSNKKLSYTSFTINDAIAEDWEVVPETATVTRESIATAIKIATKDSGSWQIGSDKDVLWKALTNLLLINDEYDTK